MALVAAALGIWSALRWLGSLLGLIRSLRLARPVRREAVRSCIVHGAITVWISIGALYAWAQSQRLQPAADFVGFLAAAATCALVVGVAAAFMQPAERAPETIGICRFRRPSPADEPVDTA